ncbi:MAG: hypothetical protein RBU30_20315 [Polyangia bacterium]|jgi:hypothetical protein|nr:hypothetical protein [Polyangia bacterium]
MLFDLEDYYGPQYTWNPAYTEDKVVIKCGGGGSGGLPVEPLKYYRRLKLKAFELYQEVSEFYEYAYTAQADAARTTSGTTESYGNAIWGKDPSELADFSSIVKSYRGLGAGYLLGTDIAYLNELVQNDPLADTGGYSPLPIENACGGSTSYAQGCPQRMIVPLQPCTVDTREEPIATALQLLRKHGAPVDDDDRLSESGTVIAGHLLFQVNIIRWQNAQPQFASVDDMLGFYSTDLTSLELANRHLQEERGLYLRDLKLVEGTGAQPDVLKGFDDPGIDLQGLLLRSKVNASRFGIDDSLVLKNTVQNDTCQEFCPGLFNFYKHSYLKLTSNTRRHFQALIDNPFWTTEPPNPDELNEPYREIAKIADGAIGTEEIGYKVTPNFFTVLSPGGVPVFLGETFDFIISVPEALGADVNILKDLSWGGSPDRLDGLRCLLHGRVAGLPCDMEDYSAGANPEPCPPQLGGNRCFSYSVDRSYIPASVWPAPIFVVVDGRPVDALWVGYSEAWTRLAKQNYQFGTTTSYYIRNPVSTVALDLVEKVIARNKRQCSEPEFNSLGLRNDLVPPLETELISNSNSYEDSFQYYLQKATDAATYASAKIQTAISSETESIRFQNEVETARATAENRLEQICGAGREACSSSRMDVVLGDSVDGLVGLALIPEVDIRVSPTQPELIDCAHYLSLSEPPAINHANDLRELGRYARCQNMQLIEELGKIRVRKLPVMIANDPRNLEGRIQLFYDGEYLASLLETNIAILELAKNLESLGNTQNTLGLKVEAMRDRLQAGELNKTAHKWRAISAIFSGAANAAGAAAMGNPGGALLSMASTVTGVMASFKEQQAQEATLRAELKEALLAIENVMSEVRQLYDTLHQNALRVEQTILKLDALELEQKQTSDRASRQEEQALDALVGADCPVGETGRCLKGYHRLVNVKHREALKAMRRAQRMAFIARRALELKLAVDFTKEKAPGIIVDPPSLWVDGLYQIWDADGLALDLGGQSYVQKLADYLFGYPFDHPFADADDTTVLSLRDDFFGQQSRGGCVSETPSTNYAYLSQSFDSWAMDYGVGQVDADVAMAPVSGYGNTADRISSIEGDGIWLLSADRVIDTESLGYLPGDVVPMSGAIWVQALDVPIQIFWVAGYKQFLKGEYSDPFGEEISIVGRDLEPGSGWVRVELSGTMAAPESDEYTKVFVGFGTTGPVLVWGAQLNHGASLGEYQVTPTYQVDADCQLVEWVDPYTNQVMTDYARSPATLATQMRRMFRIKCVDQDEPQLYNQLDICGPSSNVEYFETDFQLTMEEIQAGKIVGQDQIAVGNYNYRVVDLAVNLVGSNVKDCSLDPGAGTACYQNLFIPYDLSQNGAVRLLDYSQSQVLFDMPTARIHYAKALAAERLLTVPLSQTDAALLGPYEKPELRGRPLQGNYTLRIYNVPGLRWENIEDVQIYLKYRYWSAFSNP